MDNNSIALVITIVLGFTGVLSWLSYKQKRSHWTGKIIDKIYIPATISDDGGSDEQFRLVCLTTDQKKIIIGVFKNDYEFFEIGDKIEKKAGDYLPKKKLD